MKKILFMLPILAVALVSCNKDNGDELSGDDIIQFKDPNFLKALLIVKECPLYDIENDDVIVTQDIDVNKDGQISIQEVENVRALDLNEYDENGNFLYQLSNIDEIKYFISIESLFVDYNLLENLDISKNIKLKYLSCYRNELETLKLNSAITFPDCSFNNLSVLDLSNTVNLISLQCNSNQLISLDVSNNTALINLYCSNNPLETLTISESQQNAEWLDDVKAEYPDIEIIVK